MTKIVIKYIPNWRLIPSNILRAFKKSNIHKIVKKIEYLPSSSVQQAKVKPIYEIMKGWKGSIAGIKNIEDLPYEAKLYIQRVEELIQCKIILISTSPERSDTIVLENPFDVNWI